MRVIHRLLQARFLRWAVVAVLLLVAIWLLLPKPDLYPPEFRFSRALEDRNGKLLHLALTPDGKYRRYTPLAHISPALVQATLTLEDRHFYDHPGVNPLSLLRAVWGVVSRSSRGGGSTITMQLARLRHGLHTRTPWGKVGQMFRAVQMERHYSKDAILEAYLNQAPYGGNVEGVGAASLLWCGRPAAELTLREAVALSVLPQSPTTRRPRPDGGNALLAAAQHRLWERLRLEQHLPADPLDAAFTLRQLQPPARETPHLARRLFTEHVAVNRVSSGHPLRCTVDAASQRRVEQSLQDYLDRKREVGITNACALLVQASSREVLAYVGSSRFLDSSIQGQVDGVLARRSPGSALKPFIYALAMQEGVIHPHTLLRDGRMGFGSYNPENFDRHFAGPIAAQDALYHSRNVPAVSLAQRLAPPGLYGFLKNAGVALPHPASHYGLSLPLGSGEVSMEELAELYALLASDGHPRRLRYSLPETTSPPSDLSPLTSHALPSPSSLPDSTTPLLLTPESRHLTREMLRTREGEPALDDPAITWKTGTSHGFRDAWAAGIRGDYVLVVWIGNFDGKANPAFIARECAAPLLFEVFRHLRLPMKRDAPPLGVSTVELCAVSGQLPTPHCQHRVQGGFIPGVSPITACDVHRQVFVDPTSGLRAAHDDGRPGLRREVYEFWPPDMLEMFKQAGVPRKNPPPLEPSAQSLAAADASAVPRIVSPKPALVYTLQASDTARQSIPLRADTAPGVSRVFWFAGSRFLGASDPATAIMWPAAAGQWHVHVLDDHGRSAEVEVKVEMVP